MAKTDWRRDRREADRLGRGHDLRPSRRRDQRHLRGAADAPGQDPLHPGAARGGGGVRRLRLRQVHRAARRLHRHLRARGHPPAQRPLRRQVRRAPVLAITGHTFHDLIGTHYQQEVDLMQLFMDVAVLQRADHRAGSMHNALVDAAPHGAVARGASRTSDFSDGYPGLDGSTRSLVAANGPRPHVGRRGRRRIVVPQARDAQGAATDQRRARRS